MWYCFMIYTFILLNFIWFGVGYYSNFLLKRSNVVEDSWIHLRFYYYFFLERYKLIINSLHKKKKKKEKLIIHSYLMEFMFSK